MPKKAYAPKQIVITSNRLYIKKEGAGEHVEMAFVVRNMESMWAIEQKHMHIVNNNTCSITVYFRAEIPFSP